MPKFTERVGFDLLEAVNVQLAHKRTVIVGFEVFRKNFCEFFGIVYRKGPAWRVPANHARCRILALFRVLRALCRPGGGIWVFSFPGLIVSVYELWQFCLP